LKKNRTVYNVSCQPTSIRTPLPIPLSSEEFWSLNFGYTCELLTLFKKNVSRTQLFIKKEMEHANTLSLTVPVFKHFINIGKELQKFGNMHSLFALCVGLKDIIEHDKKSQFPKEDLSWLEKSIKLFEVNLESRKQQKAGEDPPSPFPFPFIPSCLDEIKTIKHLYGPPTDQQGMISIPRLGRLEKVVHHLIEISQLNLPFQIDPRFQHLIHLRVNK